MAKMATLPLFAVRWGHTTTCPNALGKTFLLNKEILLNFRYRFQKNVFQLELPLGHALFETVPGRTMVESTESEFLAIERPKTGKKSWRETLRTTGAKFQSKIQ